MGQWTELDTPHGRIGAWRADAASPTGRAVVVIQEIFGVNAHIRDVADRFAAAGLTALAPCVLDSVEPGVELDYDEAGIARGRALVAELGFERAVDAVGAAAETLRREGLAVGAVGFCWGGTVAFLANTRLGLPAVSYYGGRSVPFLDEPARAPLLFHFGERDPIIPPEHRELHRRKQPQAEFHVYPAGHGFHCDRRGDFDPESAALAWTRTLEFFARHLR